MCGFNFFKLFSGAPDVKKADGTLLGTMPLRAKQYCEVLGAASRVGWYIYPPVAFSLLWTGNEVAFQLKENDGWTLLDRFYLESFVDDFQKYAPEPCKTYYPSFLDVFAEGDIVQIWSGYAILGCEGWCHQVRPPINMKSDRNYDMYEAIIDSSWYCSPLVINVKLRAQNTPIYFPIHQPLFQVVPLPVSVLNSENHPGTNIYQSNSFGDSFWSAWERMFSRRNQGCPGSYAREQRPKNLHY